MTPVTRLVSKLGAALLMLLVLASCGAETSDGSDRRMAPDDELEEVETASADVPEPVRARADEIAAVLDPEARVDRWFWDREDSVWECIITGLPRITELDLEVDAGFSELELVYGFEEVRQAVPYLAEMVLETCKETESTLLELSIRREELIAADPDLEAMWRQEYVFLEVQCPDGYDFEVDAFGSTTTRPDDDIDIAAPRAP
jgi:hypothetical protein